MRHLAPLGGVYQAGTFSGSPVVMKAGLAALRVLTQDFYRTLNSKCETFAASANRYFEENDIAVHLSRYKSMMSIRLRREQVLDYEDALQAAGGDRYGRLFHHLLKAGIYWPPADLEAFFVSGMHTKADLRTLLDELKKFFKP